MIGVVFCMLEQREAHLSRFVRRLNGPASVLLRVRREEAEGANESDAGRNDTYDEFSGTHNVSLVIYRANLLEKIVCAKKCPRF
jgi:hypothetical protein